MILVGCSHEEGSTEDMHLNAATVKPKSVANEQKDRGMTEETTRGMGEGKLGHSR